jgi:hypothetical protein
MKRNGKLTLTIMLGVISLLISSKFNLAVKAKGQNQLTALDNSQQVQQKLGELAQKFRGLVNNTGANLSLPRDGNLTEKLQGLVEPNSKTLHINYRSKYLGWA